MGFNVSNIQQSRIDVSIASYNRDRQEQINNRRQQITRNNRQIEMNDREITAHNALIVEHEKLLVGSQESRDLTKKHLDTLIESRRIGQQLLDATIKSRDINLKLIECYEALLQLQRKKDMEASTTKDVSANTVQDTQQKTINESVIKSQLTQYEITNNIGYKSNTTGNLEPETTSSQLPKYLNDLLASFKRSMSYYTSFWSRDIWDFHR